MNAQKLKDGLTVQMYSGAVFNNIHRLLPNRSVFAGTLIQHALNAMTEVPIGSIGMGKIGEEYHFHAGNVKLVIENRKGETDHVRN